jgi:hypothetical protein
MARRKRRRPQPPGGGSYATSKAGVESLLLVLHRQRPTWRSTARPLSRRARGRRDVVSTDGGGRRSEGRTGAGGVDSRPEFGWARRVERPDARHDPHPCSAYTVTSNFVGCAWPICHGLDVTDPPILLWHASCRDILAQPESCRRAPQRENDISYCKPFRWPFHHMIRLLLLPGHPPL